MKEQPVEVECYSGATADERPRRIRYMGFEFAVTSVIHASLVQDVETGDRARRFLVLTEDGLELSLVRHAAGDWGIESGGSDPELMRRLST